jgi:hypothetical protein
MGDTPVDRQSSAKENNSTPSGVTRPGSAELLALSDLFLFNAKNRAFLEGNAGRVKPATSSSRGFVLVLLIVLVGLPLVSGFVRSGSEGPETLLLQISNKTTVGVVSDSRTDRMLGSPKNSRDYPIYFLTYHYVVRGQEYTNEDEVSESDFFRLRPGSQVEVAYFSWYPRLSHISGLWLSWGVFFTISLLFLIGCVILVLVYKAYRRRRLDEHGQLLTGILIAWSADPKEAFLRKTTWDVLAKYRFSTPDGQTIGGTKRFATKNTDLAASRLGKHVAVLYLTKRLYDVL